MSAAPTASKTTFTQNILTAINQIKIQNFEINFFSSKAVPLIDFCDNIYIILHFIAIRIAFLFLNLLTFGLQNRILSFFASVLATHTLTSKAINMNEVSSCKIELFAVTFMTLLRMMISEQMCQHAHTRPKILI